MTNDIACPCGGLCPPTTVSLTLEGRSIGVPGYRCEDCGESFLDARVSSAITPDLVKELRWLGATTVLSIGELRKWQAPE